ncbi:serine/threonine-protein kinase HAL4/sat4 [Tulasnella sp. 330]|nr:serine/threonine-protein kinase HAL4/sat4 [Tulasnella sp. 330]
MLPTQRRASHYALLPERPCSGAFSVWDQNDQCCKSPTTPPPQASGTIGRNNHKKRRGALESRLVSLCPADLQECPIKGTTEVECVDANEDLRNCGGCAALNLGKDCAAIPNVLGVTCLAAQKRCQGEVWEITLDLDRDSLSKTCQPRTLQGRATGDVVLHPLAGPQVDRASKNVSVARVPGRILEIGVGPRLRRSMTQSHWNWQVELAEMPSTLFLMDLSQHPQSLSDRLTTVVNRTKTQRGAKRLVDRFLASGSRDLPNISALVHDATTLLDLCTNPHSEAAVLERLSKGAVTRARTLAILFALSDTEVDADVPLKHSSIPAQLLDMVMKVSKMGPAVAAYLSDTTVSGGAAGVRYLIKTLPAGVELISNLDSLLLAYVERLSTTLLNKEPQFWTVGRRKKMSRLTLQLLELMLQKRITYLGQLSPNMLDLILSESSNGIIDSLTSFKVIRSFVGAPPTAFPADSLYNNLVRAVMWVPSTQIPSDRHEARCLAFSALAVMHGYHIPSQGSTDLLSVIVNVLLLNTRWQHQLPKALTRAWGIPVVIPHDDAYTILSHCSPPSFIPMLRLNLEAAKSSHSFNIVEPLVSLIVDRSAEPDLFWPKMLSALIEAGMVDYLMNVAVLSPPSHGVKRDAVTGVYRCFEQMAARDIQHIRWDVFPALEWLMKNEDQPISVQDLAKAALDIWDRNTSGNRPMKPVGCAPPTFGSNLATSQPGLVENWPNNKEDTAQPFTSPYDRDDDNLYAGYYLGGVFNTGGRKSMKKTLISSRRCRLKTFEKSAGGVVEFRKRRENETEKEYVKKLTDAFCIGSTLHHPNVVETLDLVQDEHQNWCEVTEHCPGGELYDAIKRGGMSSSEVDCSFKQVGESMASA